MKDTDEEPCEAMHRARTGRALNAGASVPMGQGAPPSHHVDAFTNKEVC